jgi:hypothetical protein
LTADLVSRWGDGFGQRFDFFGGFDGPSRLGHRCGAQDRDAGVQGREQVGQHRTARTLDEFVVEPVLDGEYLSGGSARGGGFAEPSGRVAEALHLLVVGPFDEASDDQAFGGDPGVVEVCRIVGADRRDDGAALGMTCTRPSAVSSRRDSWIVYAKTNDDRAERSGFPVGHGGRALPARLR